MDLSNMYFRVIIDVLLFVFAVIDSKLALTELDEDLLKY
jgi:hypothetical protein